MSADTLLLAFEDYLRTERRSSEKTITAYRSELLRWHSFLQSEFECELLSAERAHAKRFVVWRAKQGVSNRSVNRSLSALRSFYKWCERSAYEHHDPLSGIRSLKEQKRVVMSVPQRDLSALVKDEMFSNDFSGRRDQVMLLLLYGLGLRKAELINLKVSDFDWGRGVVVVLGKRNKQRQIPVPDTLRRYARAYLELRNTRPIQTDAFLITEKGGKLYPSIVYNRVVYYLQETTTVVDKHPHALRHSYATHLLNAGVDINTVKELMGHESLSSTQVYTTSTFEELVQVYNRAHPKGS